MGPTSSTVNAGSPFGTGMPYGAKTCLPWYSWIFMRRRGDAITTTNRMRAPVRASISRLRSRGGRVALAASRYACLRPPAGRRACRSTPSLAPSRPPRLRRMRRRRASVPPRRRGRGGDARTTRRRRRVDASGRRAVPADMMLVDTTYCPKRAASAALKDEYNKPNHITICHEFAPGQKCLGKRAAAALLHRRVRVPERARARTRR